ncbi:hypothetical protein KQI49_04680 [Virgibacillus sp. MSJ-26]|uniref:hypothetical protein n=1 Tax=Virgibacillus sp. MSJ-26 TaxID=2841522 RepID=UPI001C0F9573|nr:hypothetical protein [Virgibacillus sp. MSJ-26]MBU5466126.1 hypothetical protein [Virgibacillus sp. MSJ-26]
MALFINTGEHPGVFESEIDIVGKNQSFYRKDHVSELVKEQRQVNETLLKSLRKLTLLQSQQSTEQQQQRKETEQQLEELNNQNRKQKLFEKTILDSLNDLVARHDEIETTFKQEGLAKQEIFEQLSILSESNQDTIDYLGQYESFNGKLSDQLNYMLQLQTNVERRIGEQDDEQYRLNERLENQEALTEKTIRQLDHLRASLFERTNYLVEKVEESFQLTSSYIYELLKGSNQPFTFFVSEEKSEDKKK